MSRQSPLSSQLLGEGEEGGGDSEQEEPDHKEATPPHSNLEVVCISFTVLQERQESGCSMYCYGIRLSDERHDRMH